MGFGNSLLHHLSCAVIERTVTHNCMEGRFCERKTRHRCDDYRTAQIVLVHALSSMRKAGERNIHTDWGKAKLRSQQHVPTAPGANVQKATLRLYWKLCTQRH